MTEPLPSRPHLPSADIPADARALLAAIVESSDDAILSKDLDGRVLSWNQGAERLYGYTAQEAIGRSLAFLVPPDVENDVPGLLRRLRAGERIDRYETVRQTRDGRRLNVSLTISPIRDQDGRIVAASTIARDVTERKLEESRWRLLSQLGDVLHRALDAEQLLKNLAEVVVREVADYCITYRLQDGSLVRMGAAHVDPARRGLVERLLEVAPPSIDDAFGIGAVARTQEPMLVEEVTDEALVRSATGPMHLSVLRELAPLSSMVFPLVWRGRTLGALSMVTTARSFRRYTTDDLALGREVAQHAALALDNARLFGATKDELARREAAEEQLKRRYDQLRVLYRMTEAVGRAGALDQIFEEGLDGLSDALGVRRASILLFDEHGVMRFRAWRGISEGYRRAVDGHSPWTKDTRDPQAFSIDDVENDASLDDALRATILGEGIGSLVFIPLVFHDELLGKFMLYWDAPRRWAPEELDLARTVAGTIAFAIRRTQDEQGIREAKQEAERANEAKSQFLGVMSHELRTPLNAVLGYAELLLLETRGTINPEQREQLKRIKASAYHQLGLVDEILTYSRLEAGREEARLIETDVRRVVMDVAELVRPEADAKGLDLAVVLPEEPLLVNTDPAKLRQIALNLAANAVKYTETGSVALEGTMDVSDFVLEVRDTGPGIPADRLVSIFDPFTRAEEDAMRPTTGSGLGLAIASRFAALLGGEITVSTAVGEGSTFRLRLFGAFGG